MSNLSLKQFQDLLCKNGCGFMARPTLQGYCPKCWADKVLPSSSDSDNSNGPTEPNLSAITPLPVPKPRQDAPGSSTAERTKSKDAKFGDPLAIQTPQRASKSKANSDTLISPTAIDNILKLPNVAARPLTFWDVDGGDDDNEVEEEGQTKPSGTPASIPGVRNRERSPSPELEVLEVKKPEPELITIDDLDEAPAVEKVQPQSKTQNKLTLQQSRPLQPRQASNTLLQPVLLQSFSSTTTPRQIFQVSPSRQGHQVPASSSGSAPTPLQTIIQVSPQPGSGPSAGPMIGAVRAVQSFQQALQGVSLLERTQGPPNVTVLPGSQVRFLPPQFGQSQVRMVTQQSQVRMVTPQSQVRMVTQQSQVRMAVPQQKAPQYFIFQKQTVPIRSPQSIVASKPNQNQTPILYQVQSDSVSNPTTATTANTASNQQVQSTTSTTSTRTPSSQQVLYQVQSTNPTTTTATSTANDQQVLYQGSPRPIMLSKSPVKITTQALQGSHVRLETRPVGSKDHSYSRGESSRTSSSIVNVSKPTATAITNATATTTSTSSGSTLWADWRRRIVDEMPSSRSSSLVSPARSSNSPTPQQPRSVPTQQSTSTSQQLRGQSLPTQQSASTPQQPRSVPTQQSTSTSQQLRSQSLPTQQSAPTPQQPRSVPTQQSIATIPKPPQPTRLLEIMTAHSKTSTKPTAPNVLGTTNSSGTPFSALLQHFHNQAESCTTGKRPKQVLVYTTPTNYSQQASSSGVQKQAASEPKRKYPRKPVKRLNRNPNHKCRYCGKRFHGDVRHFRNHLWIHRQNHRPYWYSKDDDTEASNKRRPQIGRRPFMLLYTPRSRKEQEKPKEKRVVRLLGCSHCPHFCYDTDEYINHRNDHRRGANLREAECRICEFTMRYDGLKRHLKTNRHKFLRGCFEKKLKTCSNPSSIWSLWQQYPKPRIAPPIQSVAPSPPLQQQMLFLCNVCKKPFGSLVELEQHKSTHKTYVNGVEQHKFIHRTYVCKYCSTRFDRADDLVTHVRQQHPDVKPHVCKECGTCFGNPAQLDRHIETVHDTPPASSSTEDDTVGSFACTYCPETFKDRDNLNAHQKIHNPHLTGEEEPVVVNKLLAAAKPCHICLKCGKEFRNIESLRGHMEKHRQAQSTSKSGKAVKKTTVRSPSKATRSKAAGSKSSGSKATESKATGSKASGSKETGSKPSNLFQNDRYPCMLCKKIFNNKRGLNNHKNSYAHKQAVKRAERAASKRLSASKSLAATNAARSALLKRLLGSVSAISDDPLSVTVSPATENSVYDPNKNVIVNQQKSPRPKESQNAGVVKESSSGHQVKPKEKQSVDLQQSKKSKTALQSNKKTNTPVQQAEDKSSEENQTTKAKQVDTNKKTGERGKPLTGQKGIKYNSTNTKSGRSRKIAKCLECSRLFLSKAKLKAHQKLHTIYRHYKCQQCENRFVDHSVWKKHLKSHLRYPCNVCEVSSVTYTGFVKHAVTCHKVTSAMLSASFNRRIQPATRGHRCCYCNRRFYRETMRIQSHMRNHTLRYQQYWRKKTQASPKGNVIGDVFMETVQTSSDQGDDTTDTECSGKKAAGESKELENSKLQTGRVSDHQEKLPEKGGFACVCGKTFEWKKSLRRHLRQGHCSAVDASEKAGKGGESNAGSQTIQSTQPAKGVQKQTGSKSSTGKTIQSVQPTKSISKETGQSILSSQPVKEAKDRAGPPYRCSDCSQMFTLWRLREEHIRRVHKNFNCQYCEKAFLVYQILMKHEKKHKARGDVIKKQTESGTDVKEVTVESEAKTSERVRTERQGVKEGKISVAEVFDKVISNTMQGSSERKTSRPKQPTKSLPKQAESSLPKPSDNSLPKPADNSLPKQSDTSLPKTSDTSLPKQAAKSLPKQADSLPKECVETLPTQHDSPPERQDENLPKQPEDSSFPEQADKEPSDNPPKQADDIPNVQVKQEPVSSDDSGSTSDSSWDGASGGEDNSSDDNQMQQRNQRQTKIKSEKQDESDDDDEEVDTVNEFKCPSCDRSFRRRLNLLQHQRVHEADLLSANDSVEDDSQRSEEVFPCDQCDRTFSLSGALKTHMKMHIEKKYKCTLCPKSFEKWLLLVRHNRNHHPGNKVIAPGSKVNTEKKKTYVCQVCFEEFTDADKMSEHKRIHSSESKYVCHVCKAVFPQSWDLIVHKRSHSREELRTQQVDQPGPSSQATAEAGSNPGGGTSPANVDHKCSVCGYVCTDDEHLAKHEEVHRTQSTCTFCGKVFEENKALIAHYKKVHYARRPVGDAKKKDADETRVDSSVDVSSSDDNYNDIDAQSGSDSDDDDVGGVNARYPRRSVRTRKYVSSDEDDDASEKRYPKRARTRPSYTEPGELDLEKLESNTMDKAPNKSDGDPKRLKSQDEPYKCSYCGIGFALEEDWVFHEYQHSQSEPFRCQYCYKVFSRRLNLVQHEKSHKGSKPYKCVTCGKQFAQESHLKRHKEREHSSKEARRTVSPSEQFQPYPHNCAACGKGFYKRGSLIYHEERCDSFEGDDGERKKKVDSTAYVGERKAAKLARIQIAADHSSSAVDDTTHDDDDDDDFDDDGADDVVDNDDSDSEGGAESDDNIAVVKDAVVKQETTEIEHKCRYCSKTFPYKKTLMSHEIKQHQAKGPHTCTECDAAYWYPYELKRHEETHTKKKVIKPLLKIKPGPKVKDVPEVNAYRCHQCNEGFPSQVLLSSHLQVHLEQQVSRKCKFCLKMFSNEGELQNHMKTHTAPSETPSSSFGCLFCHEMFTLKSALIDHIQTHSGRESYMCPHCDLTFPTSATLQAHEREHFQPTFQCSVCQALFRDKVKLIAHEKSHEENATFECSVCQALFRDKVKLVAHEKSHEENGYPCRFCGLKFIARKGLTSHIKSKHSEALDEEADSSCGKSKKSIMQPVVRLQTLPQKSVKSSPQPSTSDSNQDEEEVLSESEKEMTKEDKEVNAIVNPYSCNICKKSFPSPDKLKMHVRTHTKESSRKCQYCSKVFSTHGNLKKHLKLHLRSLQNTGDGQGKFKCQICGIYCQAKPGLVSHMKSHAKNKAKPFSFHKRSTGFGSKTKPKAVKDKPAQAKAPSVQGDGVVKKKVSTSSAASDRVTCKFCNGTFCPSSLKKHINTIHAADKLLQCRICSKRFPRSSELLNHMKTTHGTSKAYQCDHCTMRYSHIINLTNHIEQAHPEVKVQKMQQVQIYRCKFCSKAFMSKKSVSRHESQHVSRGDTETNTASSSSEATSTPSRKRPSEAPSTPSRKRPSEAPSTPSRKRPSEAPSTPPRKRPSKAPVTPPRKKQKTIDSSFSSSDTSPTAPTPEVNPAKLFDCTYCSFQFVTQEDLKRHERTHPGEKPYSCDDCGKSYHDRSHLTQHRRRAHSGAHPSKSPPSSGSSKESQDKKSTPTVNEKTKMYPCKLCSKAFLSTGNLNKHLMLKHKTRSLHVAPCSKTVKRINKDANIKVEDDEKKTPPVTEEQEPPREKKHACTKCDKRYFKKSNLQGHMERHHPDKPHKCSECDKCYKNKWHLKEHFDRNHAEAKTSAVKEEQKTPQKSPSSTTGSTITSEGEVREKKFACDFESCDKRYYRKDHLREHFNRVHGKKNPVKDEENTPQKTVSSSSSSTVSKIPSEGESSEKKFSCKLCGKRFYEKGPLKVHMERYHREKMKVTPEKTNTEQAKSDAEHTLYSCNICSRSYYSKEHLKEHYTSVHKIHVHDWPNRDGNRKPATQSNPVSQKTLTCDIGICKKKFTSAANLGRHKKLAHTSSGDKKAKSSGGNGKHQAAKSSGFTSKPEPVQMFSCKECSLRFTSEDDLEEHYSDVHEGKESQSEDNGTPSKPEREKNAACDMCDKRYYKISHLNHHKKTIHFGQHRTSSPGTKTSSPHSRTKDETPSKLSTSREGHSNGAKDKQKLVLKSKTPSSSPHQGSGQKVKLSNSSDSGKQHASIVSYKIPKLKVSSSSPSGASDHRLSSSSKDGVKVKSSSASSTSTSGGSQQKASSQAVYACHVCEQMFSIRSSLAAHLQKHHS